MDLVLHEEPHRDDESYDQEGEVPRDQDSEDYERANGWNRLQCRPKGNPLYLARFSFAVRLRNWSTFIGKRLRDYHDDASHGCDCEGEGSCTWVAATKDAKRQGIDVRQD